ncbi:MAG: chromate resistance protein [Nitrospirae bacterium]|nr:chromate resistance protein [Nitrospirota bacterium]
MKQALQTNWLLFFYSVPSKPVANRIKVWRRLAKAGALQFKGAGYILPYSEGHYEFFQWLVSEVVSMKGDAAFVKVEKIETMKNSEISVLFNQQKEKDYRNIEKGLEEFERKINSVKKGGDSIKDRRLSEHLNKYSRAFEAARKTDFFLSKAGGELKKRIKGIEAELRNLSGTDMKKPDIQIPLRRVEDYQGRTWVTRRNPFVDRMASAWLIKRFLDKRAGFRLISEQDMEGLDKRLVVFDVRGGEFTHQADMCTFEVLVKSFGLRDRAVKKIAETVHELDIKDEKFGSPEARGIEEILIGIRKTAKDDSEALQKGMTVFEMLYASKT